MSNNLNLGEGNPVWKGLSRVADMMIMSVLFIITCLPIITVGAALSGFYYAVMDSLRKEDGYIFKRYFQSFGKNFKKATVIWLIMLVTGIVFGVDIYFWWLNWELVVGKVLFVFSIILAVIWLIIFMWVFALQARFENTIPNTMKNAFLLGISHLPFTIAEVAAVAMAVFLSYSSWLFLGLMLMLGIGVLGYIFVNSFERLFKKAGYIDADDGRVKNDDYDFSVDVDFDEVHGRKESENTEQEEETDEQQ